MSTEVTQEKALDEAQELLRRANINREEEEFIFEAVEKGCDIYNSTRGTGLSVEVAAKAACTAIRKTYDEENSKLSDQFLKIKEEFIECCHIIYSQACD